MTRLGATWSRLDACAEATSYEAMLNPSRVRAACAHVNLELKNPDPLRFGWCHGSIDLPREQNYPTEFRPSQIEGAAGNSWWAKVDIPAGTKRYDHLYEPHTFLSVPYVGLLSSSHPNEFEC